MNASPAIGRFVASFLKNLPKQRQCGNNRRHQPHRCNQTDRCRKGATPVAETIGRYPDERRKQGGTAEYRGCGAAILWEDGTQPEVSSQGKTGMCDDGFCCRGAAHVVGLS